MTDKEKNQPGTADTRLISLFYKAAIVLAFLSLILSSAYLFNYLWKSPNPGDITNPLTMASFNADRRMTLISTAFFVALAFGFLGFALFLINAKGDVEGEANVGDYKVKITKLSPGLFVIACSTIIIVVCANFQITYTTNYTEGGASSTGFQQAKKDSAKIDTSNDDIPSNQIVPGKTPKTNHQKKKK